MSESPNYESDIEMVEVEEDDVPDTDSKTQSLTSDMTFVNNGSKDLNDEFVEFGSSDLEDYLDDTKGNNSPINEYKLPKISVVSPSKLGLTKLDSTIGRELVDPPIKLEMSTPLTPENASSTNSSISDKAQSPITKHPSPILYTGVRQTCILSQVKLEQDTTPEENDSSNFDPTENTGEECAVPEPPDFDAFLTVKDEFNAMSMDLNEDDNKETDEMLKKAIKKRKKKLKKAMLAQKEGKSRKYLNSKKEQSRRAQIKLNTAILRRLLPNGSCGSKHAVLLKSLDVIKHLRKRSLQYEMTLEKLMYKNYRLKRILEELQNFNETADDELLNEAALESEDEDMSKQLLLLAGLNPNKQ